VGTPPGFAVTHARAYLSKTGSAPKGAANAAQFVPGETLRAPLLPAQSFNSQHAAWSRLTHNEGEDGAANWSPDGSRIAFKSDRGGTREIFILTLDADGAVGAPVRVTSDVNARGIPVFSPDGSRLVFHSAMNGTTEIYTVGLDGSGLERLTTGSEGERDDD